MTLSENISKYHPCNEAIDWLDKQDGLREAWYACGRPDWMFLIVRKVLGESARNRIVLAACKCARLVLHLVKEGEDRPRLAIETAERWASGEAGVTIQMVRDAADAATYAAYAAAYAAYAADAAYDAAAYAAYAACDAAADAAIYAADDYAATAAAMRKKCCDAIRETFSFEELQQRL